MFDHRDDSGKTMKAKMAELCEDVSQMCLLTQMESTMLSVKALRISRLKMCCSEPSSTSHLLRLEVVRVYRPPVAPTHRTLCS